MMFDSLEEFEEAYKECFTHEELINPNKINSLVPKFNWLKNFARERGATIRPNRLCHYDRRAIITFKDATDIFKNYSSIILDMKIAPTFIRVARKRAPINITEENINEIDDYRKERYCIKTQIDGTNLIAYKWNANIRNPNIINYALASSNAFDLSQMRWMNERTYAEIICDLLYEKDKSWCEDHGLHIKFNMLTFTKDPLLPNNFNIILKTKNAQPIIDPKDEIYADEEAFDYGFPCKPDIIRKNYQELGTMIDDIMELSGVIPDRLLYPEKETNPIFFIPSKEMDLIRKHIYTLKYPRSNMELSPKEVPRFQRISRDCQIGLLKDKTLEKIACYYPKANEDREMILDIAKMIVEDINLDFHVCPPMLSSISMNIMEFLLESEIEINETNVADCLGEQTFFEQIVNYVFMKEN